MFAITQLLNSSSSKTRHLPAAFPVVGALALMQVMAQRQTQIVIGCEQHVIDAAKAAALGDFVDECFHRFFISLSERPGLGEELFCPLRYP